MTPEASQAEAVRLTRILVPAYGVVTVLLFAPATLRLLGIDAVPAGLQAAVSLPLMLVLVAILGFWFFRLSSLGHWKAGAGPRFSIVSAVLDGRYNPNEPESARPTQEVASPLGLLARDVAAQVALLDGPMPSLAGFLREGLAEAEALVAALLAHEATASPVQLARARAALGSYEDHVVSLGKRLMARPAGGADTTGLPGAEWEVTLSDDLRELAAARVLLFTPAEEAAERVV